jgi:L-amino acid N-acyltransferase YncA
MIDIRPATVADAAAIHAIYDYYVQHDTCTFHCVSETLEDRQRWLADRSPLHPVFVGEQAGRVIGFSCLSPWNTRCAYEKTVEVSVYLDHEQRGRGFGSQMLEHLIDTARSLDHHVLLAGISADQAPSLSLHDKFGFERVGHLREVGYKFDQWLDVIRMQLIL